MHPIHGLKVAWAQAICVTAPTNPLHRARHVAGRRGYDRSVGTRQGSQSPKSSGATMNSRDQMAPVSLLSWASQNRQNRMAYCRDRGIRKWVRTKREVPMAGMPCQTHSVGSRIYNYKMNLAADLPQMQQAATMRTTDDCDRTRRMPAPALTSRPASPQENPRPRG